MNALSKSALVLVIIGALNWLLVGLFRFNLVSSLFGEGSILSRVVFVVVGLAGLYCISLLFHRTADASIPAREFRRAA